MPNDFPLNCGAASLRAGGGGACSGARQHINYSHPTLEDETREIRKEEEEEEEEFGLCPAEGEA